MTNRWKGRLCSLLLAGGLLAAVAVGGQDWGDACPAGTLAGQDALPAGGGWYYSDLTIDPGHVLCESFPPPGQPALSEPIGAVSWHVSYLARGGTLGCVKDHRFEVKFYPGLSNPDRPDVLSPAATYIVEPSAARTEGVGPLWPGSRRYVLGATLDPPLDPAVMGGRGWLSIASLEPAGDCHALLAPAKEGDSTCYWYPMNNPATGVFRAGDIHYCLGSTAAGACCDDWPGQCDEDASEFICDLSGRRFTKGSCQGLDPPCGQVPGACCRANQTCVENMTRADCEGIAGAWWAGPGTTCDECCWIPDCPAGAHVEDEPCGDSRTQVASIARRRSSPSRPLALSAAPFGPAKARPTRTGIS